MWLGTGVLVVIFVVIALMLRCSKDDKTPVRSTTYEENPEIVVQLAKPNAFPPVVATAVQPSHDLPGALPHSSNDGAYGAMITKELRWMATEKRIDDDSIEQARDYSNMTVRDLRDAATKSGVAHEAIERARDGEDPRAELIALITQAELIARIEANASASTPAPIDYSNMTVRDLRDAATKLGVAHEAIERARDGEDPRAELIALIATHRGP